MKLKMLLDENMEPGYRAVLQHLYPEIDVVAVGDPGTPPKQTSDPEILRFVAQNRRVLVTKNRKSIIAKHLPDHLAEGGQTWGIFLVRKDISFPRLAEELHVIWENSDAEEWIDRILKLPYFTED